MIEKCIELGHYIVANATTVRATAEHFGMSKSYVHRLVTYNLKGWDIDLYDAVQAVLQHNLSVRHIHGGQATREKWAAIKK